MKESLDFFVLYFVVIPVSLMVAVLCLSITVAMISIIFRPLINRFKVWRFIKTFEKWGRK